MIKRIFLLFTFCSLLSANKVLAVSPTASPSATLTPTGIAEDEKVKEIRDAIKEKVNQIKEKIEKKAFVGVIDQITDATITLNNFRGKQRVRITEETTIIGASAKAIKNTDLAVEDKVIAMGEMGENEILEAKRVVVAPVPKTPPAKRLVAMGMIAQIDAKNSTLIVNELNLKTDKNTKILSQSNNKTLKFVDLAKDQKAIVVYFEATSGKTPTIKSLFVLP